MTPENGPLRFGTFEKRRVPKIPKLLPFGPEKLTLTAKSFTRISHHPREK